MNIDEDLIKAHEKHDPQVWRTFRDGAGKLIHVTMRCFCGYTEDYSTKEEEKNDRCYECGTPLEIREQLNDKFCPECILKCGNVKNAEGE